jgi:opacity protein-like surface antigen
MQSSRWRWMIVITATAVYLATLAAQADEQLFGFVRGAETLPQGKSEFYQFVTLRTGKSEGTYDGFDFETEVEHGFTDQFQASLSIENRYIYNRGVDGSRDALDDTDSYQFGGVVASGKYRILSPFKDAIGLALRLESGYLWHDEVDGLTEHEFFFAPEIDLQKNFRDDTLITELWLGSELAWGKRPAEQYDHELALQGGAGVSYRFAPNWFIGVEGNIRAEYPLFDFNNFEHAVVYAGPSLHYGTKRWWATLTWAYQVWGDGVGEPHDGQTFAEETKQVVRVKVGINF